MNDIPPPKDTTPQGYFLAFCLAGLALIGFAVYAYIPEFYTTEFWYTKSWEKDGKTFTREPSVIIRNFGLIILSVGALYFAWWRSTTADGQLALAERGHDTDRFQKAVGMLDNEDHSIKIAGILFLRNIAEESPERFARNSLEILSSFVVKRSHEHHKEITEHPERFYPHQTKLKNALRSMGISLPRDLEVAFEALPIIRDKCNILNKEEIWNFFNLIYADFSEYLIVEIDFGGANLSAVNWDNAKISQSNFDYAIVNPYGVSESHVHNCNFQNAEVDKIIGENSLFGSNLSNARFFDPGPGLYEDHTDIGISQEQLNQAWAWEDQPPLNFDAATPPLVMHNLAPISFRGEYEKTQKFGFPNGWTPPALPKDED